MEVLLSERVALAIWEKYPVQGFQSAELVTAAVDADIVIFCLPVVAHREVVEVIVPLLKPDCICLSIAKGLDETGQTAAQIFNSVLEKSQPVVLVYGPMIAEEIRAGRYAFAEVGCSDPGVFKTVHRLFSGSNLFLKYSGDISGISWSVILKNVYAMLFGVADELELGDNVRGYLIAAALRELDQISQRMGGKSGTAYYLAGLADLVTTATSEASHHHELGRKLARGDRQDISGEGVHTLAMVYQHRLFDVNEFPLFMLTHQIVNDQPDVRQVLADWLQQAFS
jgi:glycerol-3-phosphate dehydrogenase (NAD(P)+)